MAVVEVQLGRRNYQLACDDGQEAHLTRLAQSINARMNELGSVAEGTSDTMLLVLAAITMQDELNEARKNSPKPGQPIDRGAIDEEIDLAVAEAVTAIAEYVENLAERFEKR
jgi:cell division protein ZapA